MEELKSAGNARFIAQCIGRKQSGPGGPGGNYKEGRGEWHREVGQEEERSGEKIVREAQDRQGGDWRAVRGGVGKERGVARLPGEVGSGRVSRGT